MQPNLTHGVATAFAHNRAYLIVSNLGDVRRSALMIGQQKSAKDGSDVLMDNGEPLNIPKRLATTVKALQNEGARLDKYEKRRKKTTNGCATTIGANQILLKSL